MGKLEKLNIAKKSNTQLLSQKLYQMSEELAFQGSRIYEITRIKKALNEEKKMLENKNKIAISKKFNILKSLAKWINISSQKKNKTIKAYIDKEKCINKQKQINYDSLNLKQVENKLLDNLKEV